MAHNFAMFDWLPESLHVNIISLIPFKEVARASIVSKRWLRLWKNTTNIEFDENFFSRSNEFQRRDFLKFITSWIENHKENSTIEKFSLTLSHLDHETDCEIVKRCVTFATQHGVKDLVLDLHRLHQYCDGFNEPKAMFELPTEVYKHTTLESLNLVSCSFVENELIKLHALKEVYFAWMELKNEAIKMLLSNCKMIESLSLTHCWMSTKFECDGSDFSLKMLVIDDCNFFNIGFKVNAPNLTCFMYSGKVIYFKIENLLHLEEVNLDFSDEEDDCTPETSDFVLKLIADFNHVKVLTLCSYTLQVLSNGPRLPMVPIEKQMNARKLTLLTNLEEEESLGVSFMLNRCTMLEMLTFEMGSGTFFKVHEEYYLSDTDFHEETYLSNSDDEDGYSLYNGSYNESSSLDFENIFQCLTSTLKVVEINYFTGTKNEVLLLQFLIYNMSQLKRIAINVQKEEAMKLKKYHMLEEVVMSIRRASRDLEISFHY